MYIQNSNFIYANEDSSLHNVLLCSMDDNNFESNDEESNLIISTTPYKDIWDLHGKEKTSPLQFNIIVGKKEGLFDAHELRGIKKWLCREQRHWLQIEQDDLYYAFYYCILTNPRIISVGKLSGMLELAVTCDSQYAWSELYGQRKVFNGISKLFINSDFMDKKFKPQVQLIIKGNGDISLKNKTTNQIITINNCVSGEVINIDCSTFKTSTNKNRLLLDNWNRKVIELVDGLNQIEGVGNFDYKIMYRLPLRIGG